MIDWDLLRDFLALRRAGSLAGAARLLRVDQTTVGRRLHALERQVGVKLFRRTRRGYEIMPAGEEILSDLEGVESAFSSIERRLFGRDERLEGRVRVTSTETMSVPILRALATFRARHPHVVIDYLTTNRNLSLAHGETDVAIRVGRPKEQTLVGRRLGHVGVAMYAAEGYLRRCGTPAVGRLAHHDLLWFGEELGAVNRDRRLRAMTAGGTVVFRTNAMVQLTSAAVAGLGVAVLPCVLADAEPTLRRIGKVLLQTEMWIVTHRDVRDNARVRAVRDHLYEAFRELRPALEGATR
jgi:DNA-binding transcriptional LysR family regulator